MAKDPETPENVQGAEKGEQEEGDSRDETQMAEDVGRRQ